MIAREIPSLRQLRAFEAVARLESVSAAARDIHLSQPGVSQAIGALEKGLGTLSDIFAGHRTPGSKDLHRSRDRPADHPGTTGRQVPRRRAMAIGTELGESVLPSRMQPNPA